MSRTEFQNSPLSKNSFETDLIKVNPFQHKETAILIQDERPTQSNILGKSVHPLGYAPQAPMNTSSSNISQDPRLLPSGIIKGLDQLHQPLVPMNSVKDPFGIPDQDFSCLPNERIETTESCLTDTQLSPRSKQVRKFTKHISLSFKKTEKAPNTTSEFYRIGKLLGKGAFGKVNLAIHKLSEMFVAIKSINK